MKLITSFLLFFIVSNVSALESQKYTYPDVKTISTKEFYQAYATAVIVDTRTELEFQTIHILNAHRHNAADKDFSKALSRLRTSNPDKKIIFYCNGLACSKSKRAAQKVIDAGMSNVFAYESGVLEWARTHPELASYRNETPVDVQKLEASKSNIEKHIIDVYKFVELINTTDAIVLDIRDNLDQFKTGKFFMLREQQLSLNNPEKLLKKLLRLKKKKKAFLIYDVAGESVIWMNHYLESAGIKNFSFMKGGAMAYARYEIKNKVAKQAEPLKLLSAIN